MSRWTSAQDERLAVLVSTYGQRWTIIAMKMQAEGLTTTSGECERRWLAAQRPAPRLEVTTPAFKAQQAPNTAEQGEIGHVVRSPNRHHMKMSKPKRWRDEVDTSDVIQPTRVPPPPPSPQIRNPMPSGCPMYILAPGSSLAASEPLRRQLKALYLASRLKKVTGTAKFQLPPCGGDENQGDETGAIVIRTRSIIYLFILPGTVPFLSIYACAALVAATDVQIYHIISSASAELRGRSAAPRD